MNIRSATQNDLPILVEFQMDMAQETEGMVLDRNVLTAGMQAVMTDNSKGQYLVAEIDGAVAGSLLLTYEWSDWRNGTVLWIQSVFVNKKFRGKGVYKTLYAHVKSMVIHSIDLKGIRLYVDKTNTNAQKVYEALGMNGEHYQMFEAMDL